MVLLIVFAIRSIVFGMHLFVLGMCFVVFVIFVCVWDTFYCFGDVFYCLCNTSYCLWRTLDSTCSMRTAFVLIRYTSEIGQLGSRFCTIHLTHCSRI